MKYVIDVHTHSDHSDGDYSPRIVARKAKKAGMRAVVLADHNTVEGYAEFSRECRILGMDTFMGIEVSTKVQGIEMHILGFSSHFNVKILRKGLQKNIKSYDERMKKVLSLLRSAGETELSFGEIRKSKPRYDPITKYDVAKAMRAERKVGIAQQRDIQHLMNRGGIAFVPYGDVLTAQEVCRLIADSGGISVMAHPGQFLRKYSKKKSDGAVYMPKLIKKFIGWGLSGIECHTPEHSPREERAFVSMARKHKLIITGGTDWHGDIHHPERVFGASGSTVSEYEILKIRLETVRK